MFILQMATRERCPRISKEEEKIIQLLQRKPPIDSMKRNLTELNLYKKISNYNIIAAEIYGRPIDNTVTRLTIEGRVVLRYEEIG